MLHLVAHSVPPGWLFHDWREAAELWRRLEALGPVRAMAIMPDHIHYIGRAIHWNAWLGALGGYARWRNHRRDEPGRCVFLPAPPPERLVDRKHLQRTIRYTHLNPCRDHLANDPLTWAFTSHRDAVGLAVPAVVAPNPEPARFHGYVSGDPSVRPEGTPLPYGLQSMREPSVAMVVAAVSALIRTVAVDLYARGPGRRLLIQALIACTSLSKRQIAAELLGLL